VYVAEAGFFNQLKALGNDMFDLLANLNLLHHNLERDFRSSVFPVFSVTLGSGSRTKVELKYSSSRIGLEPLAAGVLKKVADVLYNADLEIENIKSPTYTGFPRPATPTEDTEVIWIFHITSRNTTSQPKAPTSEPSKSINFFDLHAALVSFCSCPLPLPAVQIKVEEQKLWGPYPFAPSLGMSGFLGLCVSWPSHKKHRQGPHAVPVKVLADESEEKEGVDKVEVEKIMSAKSTMVKSFHNPGGALCGLVGSASVKSRMQIAVSLFRGVSAQKVGASWTDTKNLEGPSAFWEAYSKLSTYYLWSTDHCQKGAKTQMIWFLSHSWTPPADWESAMGKGVKYSDMKATEVFGVAKDLAATHLGDHTKWPEIEVWVDKCCIPQGNEELMTWCVGLLEEFIMLSDGLIVVLTWSYFERLWCVYEWVCFLACHDSHSIRLCVDAFVRPRTLPLLIECIRNFSIARCECAVEADREIMQRKIDEYYVSGAAFETMLKFTAIALIAREMAQCRTALGMSAIRPWAELAADCGFKDLAEQLNALGDATRTWHLESSLGGRRSLGLDIQTSILNKVDSWFRAEIEPMINTMRSNSVKSSTILTIAKRRQCAQVALTDAGQ